MSAEIHPLLAYKWFNSHSVPIDVQIGISRLEMPLDMKVNNEMEVPQNVHITARVVSNQQSMFETSLGTHFAGKTVCLSKFNFKRLYL